MEPPPVDWFQYPLPDSLVPRFSGPGPAAAVAPITTVAFAKDRKPLSLFLESNPASPSPAMAEEVDDG